MNPILLRYSRRDVTPSILTLLSARILEKITFGKIKKLELLRRYIDANRIPILAGIAKDDSVPAIEILFVCAGKDLKLLPMAIAAALSATQQHELHGVTIVVPERDLIQAQSLTFPENKRIAIVCESEKIPEQIERRLKEVFRDRAGWVTQQVLKVLCVSESTAPGVLVCDADTILTLNRVWFNSAGNQILTPSWERRASYYHFLADLGLGSPTPEYTFVSHHMLMQPKFMMEARNYVNWENLQEIVNSLINAYDGEDLSPFCIEFELYAQYMMQFRYEKVHLAKWSNISLARNKQYELQGLRNSYASVSLHDYLV